MEQAPTPQGGGANQETESKAADNLSDMSELKTQIYWCGHNKASECPGDPSYLRYSGRSLHCKSKSDTIGAKKKNFDLSILDMNFKAGINTGNEGIFWLNRSGNKS